MKILYISRACPPLIYNSLKSRPHQAAVKFNNLLIEGLAKNNNEVHCLLTIDDSVSGEFYKIKSKKINNITYYFMREKSDAKFKYFRRIFSIIKLCFSILKEKNTVIICDFLNYSLSLTAVFIGKFLGRKSVGVVTDLPEYLNNYAGRKNHTIKETLKLKSAYYIFNLFDWYVFLTKSMSDKQNKKNKPYVVVEGIVNVSNSGICNNIIHKEKFLMYAGALAKQYGVHIMVEAFIKTDEKEFELHIYGDGDYADELSEICKTRNNIKYFGVRPNEYIVEEQLKATLLINPRPTNEEYTKYSFPSKNMEYMASGTPTLTTNLPGMPEEYKKYVYLIEDETVDGLTKTLQEILSKPREELQGFGLKAKAWVLREKNNVIQTKKILDMIERDREK